MKSTLKSIVALVLLVAMMLSATSAVAEIGEPMFYTLEEVLAQVAEIDSEAIYEMVVVDEVSFLDVNWSFGVFGYVELIQVTENDYICFNEDVMRMMLSACAGINMDREYAFV